MLDARAMEDNLPSRLHRYPLERLQEFSARVFRFYGLETAAAEEAAAILTMADRRGIDSHGIARLPAYVEMLERGLVNPKPQIRVVRERAATALIDGDNGLGLIVGPCANRITLDKALETGACVATVLHSNHYGIAGYYPLQALDRDLIGWSMSNTPPLVTPASGAEAMLGTNPIAIAFPGLDEAPIVIDMATSVLSFGRVEMARRFGRNLPSGCIIAADGRDTRHPDALWQGGALLPLGSDHEHSVHKGYCLAAMVDILCGVLSGANWGPFVPSFPATLKPNREEVGKGLGHVFGAVRIDSFMQPSAFKERIDHWTHILRSSAPAPGTTGPTVPGSPEALAEVTRRKHGVPLPMSLVERLRYLATHTDVPFD
jgi:LDH2 family malate/lactate/ureidoglycolate dehydrogenase